MIVHRGQVWAFRNGDSYTNGQRVFVCGVEETDGDTWVWYVHLLTAFNIMGERPAWRKARQSEFERKFLFANCVIEKRAYWKKRATGELIQITGLKDDGWKHIRVYYELNKIDIHFFLDYFTPASREEALAAVSRDLKTPKNMRKMRRRLEMAAGDPNEPVSYE